ncbi:hypothetical protein TNCV_3129351 [Trichonephila clavipes]|nr:hypothetical protein TNCV_3129351 [Trichonephila clavipes]
MTQTYDLAEATPAGARSFHFFILLGYHDRTRSMAFEIQGLRLGQFIKHLTAAGKIFILFVNLGELEKDPFPVLQYQVVDFSQPGDKNRKLKFIV